MQPTRKFWGPFLLAATMIAPVIGAGCAARVRYYDADHGDYHRWDDREDRAYHRYWNERREEYREWTKLNDREQRDYWKWRHDHPDR